MQGAGLGLWSCLSKLEPRGFLPSLPFPALPPSPPPVTVTVTFPAHPHGVQTPVPGRASIILLLQSCSLVPHDHSRASPSLGALQHSLHLHQSWGGKGEGQNSILLLLSNPSTGLERRRLVRVGAGR